ncbi:18198_t:CDS:2 [Gigaspora margarita]|uniref:18198_t:CDS:1 n=1 Tax=Gigaspora margarita TaxID=4874 RepID=A0ABM8W6N3_GIGMA|nr:18198_t:CDS:2 [Gigaspora margarita]
MSYYNQQVYGKPLSQSLPSPRQGSQPPPTNCPPSQYDRSPPSDSQTYFPPGADPQLYVWFRAVDTDKSDWSPFNIETVRLMMNMFDADNSGTISFSEFVGLWQYIDDWKKCFQKFDVDGSGTINFQELKTAFKTFGYNLSDNFINLLLKQYDKYGRGDITFDNFVQLCVTIKTFTDAFRSYDTDNDGWILISYEQVPKTTV